ARTRPRRLLGRAAPRAPPGGPVLDVALRANAAIRRACGAAVTPCGDGPTKRLCPAMNGRWNRTHGGRAMTKRKSIDRRDFVTTTTGVAPQQGHDLFQFLSPPGAFEPQLLDMGDLVREAERQHGPLIDLCKRSTYNPVTRKWFGFSDNYVPDPGDYLKSVWTEIGMPDGPATWEDLVKAAPLIKGKHPEIQIPIGIGMSQELDSNMAARAMLWSYDGSVQDANENVV